MTKLILGNIKLKIKVCLSASILSIIFSFFSCRQEPHHIDKLLLLYSEQDIDGLKKQYKNLKRTNKAEASIYKYYLQLSNGIIQPELNCTNIDKIWCKIAQARAAYYKGSVRKAYDLLVNEYDNLDDYPDHIKYELSTIFLAAARHVDTYSYELLSKSIEYSEGSFSNLEQRAYQLVNLIYTAERLYDLGYNIESEAVLLFTSSLLEKSNQHWPIIQANILSLNVTLKSRDLDSSAIHENEKLIELCTQYPSLKQNLSNALSNQAYLESTLLDYDLNSDSLYNESRKYGEGIMISELYSYINQARLMLSKRNISKAYNLLSAAMSDVQIGEKNKIIDYGLFTLGEVVLQRSGRIDKLFLLAEDESVSTEVRFLSFYKCALFYFERENFPEYEKCFNNMIKIMNGIHSEKKNYHFSDVIHEVYSMHNDYLFKQVGYGKEDLKFDLLSYFENGKNRKLQSSYSSNHKKIESSNYHLENLVSGFRIKRKIVELHSWASQIEKRLDEALSQIGKSQTKVKVQKETWHTSESMRVLTEGLGEDEMLLSFFHTGKEYLQLCFDSKNFNISRIPNETLDKLILNSRNCISKKEDAICTNYLDSLYQLLIQDKVFLNKKVLYLSLDHTLFQLPFASLFNKDTEKYLVEDFDIIYCNTLKKLEAKSVKEPINKFLLLSYSDENTIKSLNPKELPELAYGFEEVSLINRMLQGENNVDIAAGRDMTKNYMDVLNKYQIIHVASHSSANLGVFEDNYLVFRSENSGLDTFYTHELRNKNLAVKNVVLSTCNSSQGQSLNGEGVFSISRDFLFAGAFSTISSLWAVDDKSSSKLFEFHYTNIQKSNSFIDISLAQRKYLEAFKPSSIFSHPYYWSGFVTNI